MRMKLHRKHPEPSPQTAPFSGKNSDHATAGGVQRFIDNRTVARSRQDVFPGGTVVPNQSIAQLRNVMKAGGQGRGRLGNSPSRLWNGTVQRFTEDGRFINWGIADVLRERGYASGEDRWINDDVLPHAQKAALEHFDDISLERGELRKAAPMWEGYDVIDFCASVTARVVEPRLINQANTQTCGAVSILYLQALKKPMDYVNSMAEIFFGGRYKGNPITESERIKANDKNMNIADLLYVVPFRQRDNWVFNFYGEGGDGWMPWLRAFTTPWYVAKWMREVLGARNVETNFFFTQDQVWQGMTAVQNQLPRKDVVLFVSAEANSSVDIGTNAGNYPNHYVVLKDMTVHPAQPGGVDTIDLRVYTWGDIERITLTREALGRFVWGTIAGEIPPQA